MSKTTTIKELETVWLKVDDVHPYEGNPRKIDDKAIDAVAESLRDVGWKMPIAIDEKHVILAGHTRLQAAKKLGYTEVPCWVFTDLTEEQKIRYRVVDNKSGEKALWDFERLQIELSKIDLSHSAIEFNFSPLELDTIMQADWQDKPIKEEKEIDQEKVKHLITLSKNEFIALQQAMGVLREMEPELTDGQCVERIAQEWSQIQ